MKILITIIWFLIFAKLFFFWLWLWQLKEFHWGRFFAHFEAQATRKFLFSFKGLRFPKKTNKIIAISLAGIIFEAFILFLLLSLSDTWFYLSLLILLLLAPIISSIIILAFQIPTSFMVRKIINDAGKKRETFKDLLVIGITGSYGKTSVKEFLGEILSQKFNVIKTEKHINAEIGIAKTILEKLKPEHEILIAEIGAYERGKIKEVCQMLKPKIGILTGIGNQHLSTFGSLENIKKAKYELIEGLPKDGVAIIYDKLELTAKNIKVEKESISFSIYSSDGDEADFRINLLGRQNVINILLAASCAKRLGIGLGEISMACLNIKPEQGGMKFLKKENPFAIDASYSANYEGVIADLEYLKQYEGRKIIVMPCLIELNGVAKEVHKKIGRRIAEICDLAIITTADYFNELKNDSQKITLIENPQKIIEKLKKFNNSGDIILLEGRLPRAVVDFFQKK